MTISEITEEEIQSVIGYSIIRLFGRDVLAPGQYGRYSINHIWFKKTLCYSIRCDDFSSRNPKKKLFSKCGAWYRESKDEMIVSMHDIFQANSVIVYVLRDVFDEHREIHCSKISDIGDFKLKSVS